MPVIRKKSDRVSVGLSPDVGDDFTKLCKEYGVAVQHAADAILRKLNKGEPVRSSLEIILQIKLADEKKKSEAAKIASKKDHSDAKRLRSKGWYCESPTKNQRNKNHKNDNTLMPYYR